MTVPNGEDKHHEPAIVDLVYHALADDAARSTRLNQLEDALMDNPASRAANGVEDPMPHEPHPRRHRAHAAAVALLTAASAWACHGAPAPTLVTASTPPPVVGATSTVATVTATVVASAASTAPLPAADSASCTADAATIDLGTALWEPACRIDDARADVLRQPPPNARFALRQPVLEVGLGRSFDLNIDATATSDEPARLVVSQHSAVRHFVLATEVTSGKRHLLEAGVVSPSSAVAESAIGWRHAVATIRRAGRATLRLSIDPTTWREDAGKCGENAKCPPEFTASGKLSVGDYTISFPRLPLWNAPPATFTVLLHVMARTPP